MLSATKADLQVVFDREPATTNWFEVVLTYAGFHAMLAHRLFHWLQTHHVPFPSPRHFLSGSVAELRKKLESQDPPRRFSAQSIPS